MEARSLLKRPFPPRHIDLELQEELRKRLLLRIIFIDLAVIFAAAAGGYILAGRTLRPIQTMVIDQHRFITDASHELRTPLTAMRSEMEANLLSDKMTDRQARELIKSSLEEIINLQILSDGLLTLAQIQNSSPDTTQQNVSLKEVLTIALTKVTSIATKKRILITNNYKNFTVLGHQEDLVQLFVILLDNAVKYSPAKSTISVIAKNTDHNVIVEIIDEGTGIEKADFNRIFDRFYRSDKSRQRKEVGGYGLGLSIARQIITDHRGSITVSSSVGKGSTFTVKLPLISKSR